MTLCKWVERKYRFKKGTLRHFIEATNASPIAKLTLVERPETFRRCALSERLRRDSARVERQIGM